MDIAETLKNPWVLGGGVLFGVLLITMRSGGSVNPGTAPNSNALFAYATNTSAQQSQKEIALAQVTAGDVASFRSALLNMIGAENNYNVAMAQINAGVVNAALASHTALALDINDNANRTENTRIVTKGSVDVATINGRTATTVANTNADAQVRIEQTRAQNSMFGNIIGGVVSIAKMFL